MSLKLGLEVEFFVTKGGKLVDVAEIGEPHDEYPLLAEARGEPSTCPFKAVASVRAEIEKIVYSLREKECRPLFTNWMLRDKHVRVLHEAALRRGINKRIAWQNSHGKSTSEKNETHISAGMHISFTNPSAFTYTEVCTKTFDGKQYSYNENRTREIHPLFDVIKLFRDLETTFGADIKKSERTPGFYELKSDGRIEYRSLPATLIHKKNFADRLASVLS